MGHEQEKKDVVIGLLGGCGTYATIHIFEQFAEMFPAEREWERPRIVIDNNCTLPSRVRAYLYNEKKDILIEQMADSFSILLKAGCSHIMVGCNTAHLFLNDVFEVVPEAREKTINIIEECVKRVAEEEIGEVFLLGSEGTVDSGVYQSAFSNAGIVCRAPEKEEYCKIRECIEAVKQNNYTDSVKETFCDFIMREQAIILGCTELPILYDRYCEGIEGRKVFDPISISLSKIKKIYDGVVD